MFRKLASLGRFVTVCGLCGLLATAATSCKTYSKKKIDPVTTDEVILLSRQGKKPEEIITKIKDAGTIYDLNARDIWELIEKGVDDRVVNYMKETLEAEKERQRARSGYYYYGHSYWGPGWGWGRYPYCW